MRVSFILIIESLCDLCRSPIVAEAYCWMNMWLRWVEKECTQNFNKGAVKISTWKSEKEIDITVKVVRMGSGWN